MKTNQKLFIAENKRLTVIALIISLLLSIPLIAMQFTKEVNWSLFDFVVAGVLLSSAGIAFEIVMRKIKTIQLKTVLLAVLFFMLCFMWVELAVGIFNTPFGGN